FEPNSGQTGPLVPWFFATAEYAMRVAIYIVVAQLALTVHRLILLDDASPSWSMLRTPFARTFVTWFVAIAVGSDAATALPRIVDRVWVTIVIALAAYFAILRMVLIFPAVAVSKAASSAAERLRRSWSRTKDLWWVIFFGELLAALPVLLAVLLPYLVVLVIL